MELKRRAFAGTMESSDAYVEIEPCDGGVSLRLESVVEAQFGDQIRASVLDVLKQEKIENALVRVVDKGALDCVIRARVEAAVLRGKGEEE